MAKLNFKFFYKMPQPFMQILGRKDEIEDLLDVLYKTRMKNITLVGPAGVGKTELVREVARQAKDIGWSFYCLDTAEIVSDTAFRGELEEKFKEAFDSVSRVSVVEKCVIFIDEVHLLYHAGETVDHNSVTLGNLLKPYLSDGRIVIWGATTEEEWKETILKDPALERRMPRYSLKPLPDSCKKKILTNFIKKCDGGVAFNSDYIDKILQADNCLEHCLEKIDIDIAHYKRTGEIR